MTLHSTIIEGQNYYHLTIWSGTSQYSEDKVIHYKSSSVSMKRIAKRRDKHMARVAKYLAAKAEVVGTTSMEV